jgi:hypothetical protein
MRDPLRLTLVLCVLGACGALGACSREPPHAAHTVAWYLGHRGERAATVGRCTNDPGSYGKTPDCVNALAAAERADIGSLRNLPPMGLMSGKTQASHGRETPPRSP